MRNKATLPLIEMAVMVLVFALAAAVCLRVFLYADKVSDESSRKATGLTQAISAAETLKSCNGSIEEAKKILGGKTQGNVWIYENVVVSIDDKSQKKDGPFGVAVIEVKGKEDTTLFSFETSWQEPLATEGGNGHE